MHLRSILFTSFVFLSTAMTSPAQDTPSTDPNEQLIKQLAQQKRLLDAQKDLAASEALKLKSEQDLAKQKFAPATEEATAAQLRQTAHDKEITDAIAKVSEAAAKLPAGSVTSATGLVTTPVSTALALKATEDLAEKIATALLAVDYRVAHADGKLVTSEVEWEGYAQEMPTPTALTSLRKLQSK